MTCQIHEDAHIPIPMQDGCKLAARIWRPAMVRPAPVPAILEYIPYRKRDGTALRDEMTHPFFASHGYASVRVDLRGHGESEGLMFDEYTSQEHQDCLEVLEWIAAQSWCNGRIGMMGISWGGFNSLQVAALRPVQLKAVISLCSTDHRYTDDIHYKGGCLINENLGWSATMLSYSSRPPDPALTGDHWRDEWLARLEHQLHLAPIWLRHPDYDDYWRQGSICEDYSQITAPVLAIGGWNDAYSNAVARLVRNLDCPARGIIGPWVHKYPHFAIPKPQIDFLGEALRWWDQWLKGHNRGVLDDPPVRVYVMDSISPQTMPDHWPGRWVGMKAWPNAEQKWRRFYLSDRGLSEQAGSGDQPIEVCTTQTVGQDSGEFCAIWLGPELPGDQRNDDANSCCFDSQPLENAIDLVGQAHLDLVVSSTVRQARIALRLCDVRPDGSVARISWALYKLNHQGDHTKTQLLEPGRRYQIRIAFDDCARHIPAGHRLRLSISTSYWPILWPCAEAATIRIYPASSMLALPVLGQDDHSPVQFAPGFSCKPAARSCIREPSHKRQWHEDDSGATILEIEDDFGQFHNHETGLITGSVGRETYRIRHNDPLSARAETHWTQEVSRGDWQVSTETRSCMYADKTHYYLDASIKAYEHGTLIFTKIFHDTIPRESSEREQ